MSDKYRGGRHLEAITLIKDLTGVEKAVLHHIASQIDFRDFSKSRYMSFGDISEATSFSRRSCMRSVNTLVDSGYIRRSFQPDRHKNLPNIYWVLDKVFHEIEKRDANEAELANEGSATQSLPSATQSLPQCHTVTTLVTESHYPSATQSLPSDTVALPSDTVARGWCHSGDEAPIPPSPPETSIYTLPNSVPAPDRPNQPTGSGLRRDLMGAIAKRSPSVSESRVSMMASVVNAANRPGPGADGRQSYYPPYAEWKVVVKELCQTHSGADFDALLPYLAATGQAGKGVIVPANLGDYLRAAVSYRADPSSIPKSGESMSSYSDYMKKLGRPAEAPKEVDWVSTLDIYDLKSRLSDPSFPCSSETHKKLVKRYLDLGGDLAQIPERKKPFSPG